MGIGYLAASARMRGINVKVIDGKLEGHMTIRQTVEAVQSHRPAIIGFSTLTIDYPRCAKIAQELKMSDKSLITVVGGPHCNALASESLANCQYFDYLIAGEAETALPDLVETLQNADSPGMIPGLCSREGDGSIRKFTIPATVADLSSLPFPAWDLFQRVDTYPIMTERGCPYNCVFCSRNLTQRIRSRPVGHVMEEIEWLHREFDPEWIHFEDETFGINPQRTEDLLGRLIEFNRDIGIRFKAQTRVDHVSKPIMRLMKKAGFEYLELGVESGDGDVLSRSGKNISLEQVETAVKTAKDVGIKVWLKFIIGLPGETKDTVKNTINFAVKLNPHRLSAAIIVAYPGSRIYEWACKEKNGYRLLSKDWGRFDKYLFPSVELVNLDYRTMRRLQIQIYLETYTRNFRLLELLKMLWNNRSLAVSFGHSMISSAFCKSADRCAQEREI